MQIEAPQAKQMNGVEKLIQTHPFKNNYLSLTKGDAHLPLIEQLTKRKRLKPHCRRKSHIFSMDFQSLFELNAPKKRGRRRNQQPIKSST
jgi:hypothetical protein